VVVCNSQLFVWRNVDLIAMRGSGHQVSFNTIVGGNSDVKTVLPSARNFDLYKLGLFKG
jgi:hypothetical protein